jgi:uncharacterized protein YciI
MKTTFVLLFTLLLIATPVLGQKAASPEKTAREFISAFNRRDLDGMMSMTVENVIWFTVRGSSFRTETAGRKQLRDFLEGYFKSCPTCRSTVTRVTAAGSRVTMTETATWKTEKGVESNESFAVYEFENGKIARVYYYENPDPAYDESLAKRVGADERGMKMYVFVLLKSGKKTFEKEERAKLIAGHMENIGRLAEARTLVLAGPFAENDSIRGIYVFDVRTKEEAEKLVVTDPAVAAGVFDVEFRLWYGSAALLELDRIHKLIQKRSF